MLIYDTFNNGKATMISGPFHLHKVASNHRFISIFSLISMCSREESADSLEARRLAACVRRGAAAHWLNDYAIDTWMIGRALPTNSCDCFLMRASSPLPTCGTLGHCPVTDHTARHQVPRRAYWTITSLRATRAELISDCSLLKMKQDVHRQLLESNIVVSQMLITFLAW